MTDGTAYYGCVTGRTPEEIADFVKANCADRRVVRPISAWTYLSLASPPRRAELLGWARGAQVHLPQLDDLVALRVTDALGEGEGEERRPRLGDLLDTRALLDMLSRDHLLLRCHWGWYESVTGGIEGLVPVQDPALLSVVDAAADDDVFAIDLPTFCRTFVGIVVLS